MKLKDIIIERIKKNGPIPFDEFMNMALYYPEAGYYTKSDLKIGRQGDFFTASHLGKVFGLILSKQIKLMWGKMGCPDEFAITEIGPGMGYLAEDIMEELLYNENDKHSFKYYLIEINPHLENTQRERLKKYQGKIFWYDSIDKLEEFQGVLICNEIFDAFPVRVFEIRNNKVFEVYVRLNTEEFTEELKPARQDTVEYINEFAPWILEIDGYRSEINLAMKEFIKTIYKMMKRGFVLIFDYGWSNEEYYSYERKKGSLLCYYKHSVNENPYLNTGEQDITAHVNFTALKKWAEEAGFNVDLYLSQSKFLISLCDEPLLEQLQKEDLIQKFKRLVLPSGMGESHRVMILSKL
ncbi:class I SAM-dependent methyltransferase [Thermodesulfovibrio thiophilus]|uniref:class I SAM-dependent methyltransferase n=1 Tax=Thermodesulfovibrio thiophilus TaxID=340095 RepID=UPI00180E8675|nr:SAM-dependent methyltransferase [Thermodesulfovibrio thiophilus]HHW20924.1 methyltransferase [Thermodesulfovibrio thiophilus]